MSSATIRLRASVRGDDGDVRLQLPQPMESGLRRDADGSLIPADFLTSLSLRVNGRLVIEAGCGPSVAANPLFAFRLQGVRAGDTLTLAWRDNQGRSGSAEAVFEAA